jgi:hypothetical protein
MKNCKASLTLGEFSPSVFHDYAVSFHKPAPMRWYHWLGGIGLLVLDCALRAALVALFYGSLLFLFMLAAPAHALTIEAATVSSTDPITFSVTFSAVPDLNGPDAFGWAVTADLTANPWAQPQLDFVCASGAGYVLVRDGETGDSLSVLPFMLAGRTVAFAAPASMIGDAQFKWRLGVAVNGALSDDAQGYGGLVDPHTLVATRRTSWGKMKALYAGR